MRANLIRFVFFALIAAAWAVGCSAGPQDLPPLSTTTSTSSGDSGTDSTTSTSTGTTSDSGTTSTTGGTTTTSGGGDTGDATTGSATTGGTTSGSTTGGQDGCTDRGTLEEHEGDNATHVSQSVTVEYDHVPPSIGNHWGIWAPWGEYDEAVPPEVFVHNLEHGGVALLYDCPEGCPDLVEGLREFATTRPDDDGGAFRYVLTPYSGLPTPVAAAAWGATWTAECLDGTGLPLFVDTFYRTAPEDISSNGSWTP